MPQLLQALSLLEGTALPTDLTRVIRAIQSTPIDFIASIYYSFSHEGQLLVARHARLDKISPGHQPFTSSVTPELFQALVENPTATPIYLAQAWSSLFSSGQATVDSLRSLLSRRPPIHHITCYLSQRSEDEYPRPSEEFLSLLNAYAISSKNPTTLTARALKFYISNDFYGILTYLSTLAPGPVEEFFQFITKDGPTPLAFLSEVSAVLEQGYALPTLLRVKLLKYMPELRHLVFKTLTSTLPLPAPGVVPSKAIKNPSPTVSVVPTPTLCQLGSNVKGLSFSLALHLICTSDPIALDYIHELSFPTVPHPHIKWLLSDILSRTSYNRVGGGLWGQVHPKLLALPALPWISRLIFASLSFGFTPDLVPPNIKPHFERHCAAVASIPDYNSLSLFHFCSPGLIELFKPHYPQASLLLKTPPEFWEQIFPSATEKEKQAALRSWWTTSPGAVVCAVRDGKLKTRVSPHRLRKLLSQHLCREDRDALFGYLNNEPVVYAYDNLPF